MGKAFDFLLGINRVIRIILAFGNRVQASGLNALPLRGLSLPQPDLMIHNAWCHQRVVSDQFGVRG
jgi:hypothetical protein